MLAENIRILRKQKGFSQETLAQQLNVVRQTVSKWEKGYSVPDAEMLNTLADLLEVPVSTLLGSTVEEEKRTSDSGLEEMAKQLAILNEYLANKTARRRKTIKRVLIGLLITSVLLIIVWYGCVYFFRVLPPQNAVLSTTWITGTLNGETYSYAFTHDQNYQIYEAGGDAWIANHVLIEQYDDASIAIAQIENYFMDHGGTFEVTEETD